MTMNLKELHSPTFRQEDNRLYLVGNTIKEPKEYIVIEHEGIDNTWNEVAKNPKHTKWLQSEIKYPVRESDRDVIERYISQSFKHGTHGDFKDQLREGIICNPELMERLVLNKSIVSLCEESCDNSWCKTRGCMNPVNGDDVRLEVTLKEEPKVESEDEGKIKNEIVQIIYNNTDVNGKTNARQVTEEFYKMLTRKQP